MSVFVCFFGGDPVDGSKHTPTNSFLVCVLCIMSSSSFSIFLGEGSFSSAKPPFGGYLSLRREDMGLDWFPVALSMEDWRFGGGLDRIGAISHLPAKPEVEIPKPR